MMTDRAGASKSKQPTHDRSNCCKRIREAPVCLQPDLMGIQRFSLFWEIHSTKNQIKTGTNCIES